jgi:hypothetical protein
LQSYPTGNPFLRIPIPSRRLYNTVCNAAIRWNRLQNCRVRRHAWSCPTLPRRSLTRECFNLQLLHSPQRGGDRSRRPSVCEHSRAVAVVRQTLTHPHPASRRNWLFPAADIRCRPQRLLRRLPTCTGRSVVAVHETKQACLGIVRVVVIRTMPVKLRHDGRVRDYPLRRDCRARYATHDNTMRGNGRRDYRSFGWRFNAIVLIG